MPLTAPRDTQSLQARCFLPPPPGQRGEGKVEADVMLFIPTLENGEKTKDCGTAARQDTLLGKWFWTWVSERKKAWKALLPIYLLPTYLGKRLGSEFLTYCVQELMKGIYKWLAISTDNIFQEILKTAAGVGRYLHRSAAWSAAWRTPFTARRTHKGGKKHSHCIIHER